MPQSQKPVQKSNEQTKIRTIINGKRVHNVYAEWKVKFAVQFVNNRRNNISNNDSTGKVQVLQLLCQHSREIVRFCCIFGINAGRFRKIEKQSEIEKNKKGEKEKEKNEGKREIE